MKVVKLLVFGNPIPKEFQTDVISIVRLFCSILIYYQPCYDDFRAVMSQDIVM